MGTWTWRERLLMAIRRWRCENWCVLCGRVDLAFNRRLQMSEWVCRRHGHVSWG
jgi:hypothetical protein